MTQEQKKQVRTLFLKHHNKMYSNGDFGMVILEKSFMRAFEEFINLLKEDVDCPTCCHTGNVPLDNCPTCDGKGKVKQSKLL